MSATVVPLKVRPSETQFSDLAAIGASRVIGLGERSCRAYQARRTNGEELVLVTCGDEIDREVRRLKAMTDAGQSTQTRSIVWASFVPGMDAALSWYVVTDARIA